MTYADDIIQTQRVQLKKQENIINTQMQDIYELGLAMQRYEALTSNLKTAFEAIERRVVQLEQAALDEATKNKRVRDKFEAGYWQKIGE